MKTTPHRAVRGGQSSRRPGRLGLPAPRQPFVAHLGLTALLCLVALTLAQKSPVILHAPAPAAAVVIAPSLPVVNKTHPLVPAGYEPPDLVTVSGAVLAAPAADALHAMIGAARAEGVVITAVSGYRSYAAQTRLYAGYTGMYGQVHTDSLSARPGFSEHQTGLAVDIGNPDGACALERCFAATPAGAWAKTNAARFGFIIRYPDGASAVTGYDYEPWHLRYVGTPAAADIARRGLTLETYEGMPPSPSY